MNNISNDYQAFKDVVKKYERFAVIAHINPDGDAISSTIAMGLLLKKLGKKVEFLNEDTVPEKFYFLPDAKAIKPATQKNGDAEVVIALDCADYRRLGASADVLVGNAILVNIDHHPTNDDYGKVNIVDPMAAATVQIIYNLSQDFGWEIDKEIATALYAGLLTDTGGYRYSNTTPDVMEMASHLISIGVSPGELAERLLETVSFSHIKLLQRSLNSLQLSNDGKLCWVSVTKEDIAASGAAPEDIDGIVNYPRNVEGVEVGLCFKEVSEEEIKVSFRSREQIDVAMIAKSFGGGGHARAAGCTMKVNLAQAIDTVVKVISQALQTARSEYDGA